MGSSLAAAASAGPTDPEAQKVTIRYRNYRGETGIRHIRPSRIWFGSTSWHPDPQWVLEAVDLDKGAERSFAMSDILNFDCSEQDVSH
jgi:predicted DNA-binding transcriptional regulator YafY